MTQVLLEKGFPMTSCACSRRSGRRAGRSRSAGGTIEVELATPDAFEGVDIALFSAGGETSKALAPEAAARGAAVIDNSSAWRMDPDVPLVVSQVNPDDLAWHEGIIANPNCSTMQLVPPLMALRDAVGIERVVVDTYQSVAGTGHKAIVELEEQVKAHVEGRPKVATVYPHPIAFNALPHIDVFLDNGYTKEEWKVVTESRKILHLPELRVSCTAVRVPVFVSHSEAVHVETREPITPDRGARAVRRRHGRRRAGRPADRRIPACDRAPPGRTTCSSAGCARTRRSTAIAAWRSGSCRDNLRKGAASNAVEIAEVLVERGWVRRASDAARCRGRSVGSRAERRRGVRGDRVTRAERRAALEAIAAEVRACTRCRLARGPDQGGAGRGRPRHRGRVRGRGPGLQRGPRGPAVRRPRRRAAGRSCSARSAGSARTCSSPTS